MCADGETSSENCLHLMTTEADLSNSEHAIKIRKPYMITKQRERWTEEEHNKFLEALKLYGRAWRRIEEYIGSKTTVQIRSHAQKFFSKVTRESSSSNSPGIVEAIEIPPPRPKKKPNHPYPRKLGHLSIRKGALMDRQLWPSLSKQSDSEQESKSPTSVLSAFGSDTLGSTAVDTLKPCMSPVSSVDRAVTAGEMLVEQVSGSKSSSTSSEYKSNHSTAPSASLGMRDESPMELDLASKEAALVTGQQNQMTSLKLFGRTFVVAESQQPLSNKNESKHQDKIDLESQKLHENYKSTAHLSCSYENRIGPVQPNMVSFPSWWELYGVMALHFSRTMNPTPDHKSVHIDPNSNESSEADSGTTSDGNSEIAPALALKPSKNSAFNSFRPSSTNCRRGFVPYRR